MVNRVLWVSAIASVCLVGGCVTNGPSGALAELPDADYRVGGGFMIEYVAPASGRLILANTANGQWIMTKSVEAGDEFEMSLEPGQEQVTALFGEDLSKARPVLYFIPDAAGE